MLHKSIVLLSSFMLLFLVWSCDDDSPTGPDLDEAPEPPTVEDVEMDFSVFENAENFNAGGFSVREKSTDDALDVMINEDMPAFEQAALYAQFAQVWFQTMGQLPQAFFQQEAWGEPDMCDDKWCWEWSMSAEGESMTMTVTAEDRNDVRHWELRYTTEGTDEDLDNALLIASQINLDGSGGSWQLYDFFEEEPVFNVDYVLEDGVTTMVDLGYEEEDARYLYERDGNMSTLTLWDVFESGESEVVWNNEDGYGYIQSPAYHGGEQVCWDEDFINTDDCRL